MTRDESRAESRALVEVGLEGGGGAGTGDGVLVFARMSSWPSFFFCELPWLVLRWVCRCGDDAGRA